MNNFKNEINSMIEETKTPSQHEINSDMLKKAGLNYGFQRKSVYDALFNDVTSKNFDGNNSGSDELVHDDVVIGYDWSVDDSGTPNYKLNYADNYKQKMEDALKQKNIEFDRSNRSNSLYFNIDGTRYRLSDHKRPTGIDYNEEEGVDNNIIIQHPKQRYEKLLNILENINNK